MKCRWPMPGTGALPTMVGAILKWPSLTPTFRPFAPATTCIFTVGRGSEGAAGEGAGSFAGALGALVDDEPQPETATASSANVTSRFIVPCDRPEERPLERWRNAATRPGRRPA